MVAVAKQEITQPNSSKKGVYNPEHPQTAYEWNKEEVKPLFLPYLGLNVSFCPCPVKLAFHLLPSTSLYIAFTAFLDLHCGSVL